MDVNPHGLSCAVEFIYEATTQKVMVDPSSAGQRLLAFGGNKRGWPRITNRGVVWESLNAGALQLEEVLGLQPDSEPEVFGA